MLFFLYPRQGRNTLIKCDLLGKVAEYLANGSDEPRAGK